MHQHSVGNKRRAPAPGGCHRATPVAPGGAVHELIEDLLANMTEFGKSRLLDVRTLQNLGYDIALYPVTLLRLAMGAVEDGLRTLAAEGTQESLLPCMQTRSRLYELLGYEQYAAFDSAVFDFTLPPGT